MAYARFSSSPFYVYWTCTSADKSNDWRKQEADINCEFCVSAQEVVDNVEGILDRAIKMPYSTNPLNQGFGMSEDALRSELREILQRFVADVQSERPDPVAAQTV
jgi:hypothetical protein